MSTVTDSLRRFLDSVANLEDHDEVRRVERDSDGEVRSDYRIRTLADEPFVELHEDLAEPHPDDEHLFERRTDFEVRTTGGGTDADTDAEIDVATGPDSDAETETDVRPDPKTNSNTSPASGDDDDKEAQP